MNSLQNCFPNCRWSLDSSKFFLAGQKFFKLMKFHLSLFNLNSWTIGVLFRNALPIPIISGVCFSPIVWMFQDLIFRSFIYFELILHRVRDRSLVSVFYIWISSFPNTICWGARLFSSIYFGCFCQKKKINGYSCVALFLGVISNPLVYMFVFASVPCCFYCYGSVTLFEIKYCSNSSISPYSRDYVGYS
jgi:hypothetical protein